MWEQLPKEMKGLAIILAIALLFGAGMLSSQLLNLKQDEAALILPSATEKVADQAGAKEQETSDKTLVVVHVSGAVVNPGVYTLSSGSRVNDAILLATPAVEADLDALNLAALLTDGQKIAVPKIGEQISAPIDHSPAGGTTVTGGGKINLNTAGITELDSLPGIGPATAQKIIDYRTQEGSFKTVEELTSVSGIGPKKFEALKDLVTVN